MKKRKMDRFEAQSLLSDYLDGELNREDAERLKVFLREDRESSKRFDRLKKLSHAISDMPTAKLPDSIRKSPQNFNLPEVDTRLQKTRWERSSWFVRTGVKSSGVALLILFVVMFVPQIQSLYERSMERRLESYDLAELTLEDPSDFDGTAPSLPDSVAKAASEMAKKEDGLALPLDDIQLEDDEDILVGQSEIWRFYLQIANPKLSQPKISQTLRELGLKRDTPGVNGVEAPGGIQYDVIVNKRIVSELKRRLERITQPNRRLRRNRKSGVSHFTWYKTKSRRRRIPRGKARVIIWLSKIR